MVLVTAVAQVLSLTLELKLPTSVAKKKKKKKGKRWIHVDWFKSMGYLNQWPDLPLISTFSTTCDKLRVKL